MVDLDNGALKVPLSKNGRPRQVPLSPFAVAVLRKQLSRRVADCPHVFPSRLADGKPMGNIRRTWARAKKEAGLPADLRVHDLRHSFATTLANKGVGLFEIGRLLGHANLASTSRYAHHSPARLAATASVAAEAWDLLPAPVAA
jgi:integrase